MLLSFTAARTHLILACACATHLVRHMRISFWHAHAFFSWPVHAHLIWSCACAWFFGLRTGFAVLPAHAHRILTCTCAPHLHLRVRNLFCPWHLHSFCRRMSFSFFCSVCAYHFALPIGLGHFRLLINF